MKYLLIMILCSNVSGTCLPGYEWPVQYDNLYDCLQTGYKESIRKHRDIGEKEINEHGIFIKFECKEINTIWLYGKIVVEDLNLLTITYT